MARADDLSQSDLGDGYVLKFQEARDVVRAVVKDVEGNIVVTGIQVPRSEAIRSRFDASSKFVEFKNPPEPEYDEEESGDEEESEDEDEDANYDEDDELL